MKAYLEGKILILSFISRKVEKCASVIPVDVTSDLNSSCSMNEFVNRIECQYKVNIKQIVLEGNWNMIPPLRTIIVKENRKGIIVDSDMRYSIIGNQIIPIERRIKSVGNLVISQKRVLFMIDRPLRYHIDAIYIYILLKSLYIIDIYCEKENDKEIEFMAYRYEMIFHFGHSDVNGLRLGKKSIKYFPEARILFSYGCHSAQLYMKLRPPISAFCGFSYFCYGQIPGFGSNQILNNVLLQLLEGNSLSESVANVRKEILLKNRYINPNSNIWSTSTIEQVRDAVNILSLCSINEYSISEKNMGFCLSLNQIQVIDKKHIKLPYYKNTLLIIVRGNTEQYDELVFYDTDGSSIYIAKYSLTTYGSSNKRNRIILSRYGNELWILLNKCQEEIVTLMEEINTVCYLI